MTHPYHGRYPGTRDVDHTENVKRKADKIQVLEALIEMHEAAQMPDYDYIKKLKFKLRFARTQLGHMRP